MDGWNALVAVHVLAAVVGIGPTFAYHAFLRPNQTARQLLFSLAALRSLDRFPKIGGPIAVLSGIALVAAYDYGGIRQLWLSGGLLLFVAVQVVVVGLAGAPQKTLAAWSASAAEQPEPVVPLEVREALRKMNVYMWWAHALAVLLFLLMIVKPAAPLW